MTRRERLEHKLELRQEWSGKAQVRAQAHFDTAHRIGDAIPFGQPILVGHHSERRARRDASRIENNMRRGCEEFDLAKHHEEKAEGLARQLEHNIFSDDEDAIEKLSVRIAEREQEHKRMKLVNALYRKEDAAGLAALGYNLDKLREELKNTFSWCRMPFPTYTMTNLRERIRGDKQRLESLKIQRVRHDTATQAPNGVTLETWGPNDVRVTFAEKPERSILNDLRAARFFWCKGSWIGPKASLPASVTALIEQAS